MQRYHHFVRRSVLLATAAAVTVSLCGPAAAQPASTPCANVTLDYQLPLKNQRIHCTLTVNDQVQLDVSSDPPWTMRLRVDGAQVQEFSEPTLVGGETGEPPMFADIDHSGTATLLVITDRGGTGGEPMAVWKMASAPTRFVRAGELFGFRQFYRTTEGLFGNYSHASASSGSVALYRWDGDKLAHVLDLEVQVADRPDSSDGPWIRNGNTDCRADGDAADMRAAGIDPANASRQLCSQLWVGTIYQQH